MESIENKNQADLSVGSVLKEAWGLVSGFKGSFFAALLIACIGMGLAQMIFSQILGSDGGFAKFLASILSNGVTIFLSAGLVGMGIRRAQGQPVAWTDISMHSDKFVELLIAGFLVSILTTIGFILLIIPGIYLSVAYILTIPLIVDKRMKAWDAMEHSRKVVTAHWLSFFLIWLTVGVVVLISAIPLGIGLIWTIPLGCIALGVAYRRVIG